MNHKNTSTWMVIGIIAITLAAVSEICLRFECYYYLNGSIMAIFKFLLFFNFLMLFTYRLFKTYNELTQYHPEKSKRFERNIRRFLFGINGIFGALLVIGLVQSFIALDIWNQYIVKLADREFRTEIVATVIYEYIGELLQSIYSIIRRLGQKIAEDFITINNPMIEGYYNRYVGQVPWLYAAFARIEEMLGTSLVVFLLYRFKGFFTWTFKFGMNIFWSVIGFLTGSYKFMQKGMKGPGSKTISWVYGLLLSLLGLNKKVDISRGSAFFANKAWEKLVLHTENKGLLVDGFRSISPALSFRHVGIIAPSGQGKTSNYVIPNILSLPEFINVETGTSASAVITDPKGEIFEATSKYLEEQGYTIKVIRVEHPESSELFNPVQRANTDIEISKLAEILVDSGLSGGKNDNKDFWGNSAKMLLTNLIKILKRSDIPDKHLNLHNLKNFVDLMGGDGKPLINFVVKHCKDTQAITEYASFIEQDSETISNILLTIKTVLKDIAIKEIALLTSTDTIDFEVLRKEKTALFIITPFSDIEYYRFFLTILYSQIFSFCDKVTDGNDILFMLDEFGNLGKIPSFPQLITTLRSKRCSVSIILQDIEQLRMVYGKSGASSILNGGCNSKVIFGGIQNVETLKELSLMMGSETLSQSTGSGGERAPIARPLMFPDEISRMPMGSGIFLAAGHPPVKIKMNQYKDTKLKKRVLRDEEGQLVTAPLPTNKNLFVEYYGFDKFVQDVVEE